jgi:hypothetical protein
MEVETPITKDMESFTLERNSRGYTWKFKILEINLDRAEEINKEAIKRWGNPSA